jgi:CBS domain-containing protein
MGPVGRLHRSGPPEEGTFGTHPSGRAADAGTNGMTDAGSQFQPGNERESAMTPTTTDLRVADLMTIDPVVASADATIEEAEELLRHHHITGLPVVDISGRLVGVISQTDLLYLAVPAVQALIRRRDTGLRVGEVMSVPPVTIETSATIQDAARRMRADQLHRLVAVDEHGRPVGVISSMDFVTVVAEG